MTNAMMLLGLTAAAMGILAVPATADGSFPTPYRQHLDGIPLEAIRCNHSLVLVESPGADPACVTDRTAQKLVERGWTIVLPPDGRTIINSDDFPPPSHSEPVEYGWPTVIFDYPSEMKVGQEYSIYMNYTYSTVPQAHLLPDSFETDVGLLFGDGIEVIGDEFAPAYTRVHYGGTPYEYPLHRTAKLVDVDYEMWQQDEIRFRIIKPVNGEGAKLSAKVGLTVTDRWLQTDEDGTVTLLDQQPIADAVHGEERRNTSRSISTPEGWLPPVDDHLYEFLRDQVKPLEDVRQSLEGYPQEFIDEIFRKYPDLETQSHDSNAAGRGSSPAFFHLYGTLKNKNSSGVLEPAANVWACAYDVNARSNTKQVLYNGLTPVCKTIGSTGHYSLAFPRADPDNDGTTVDLRVIFELDNSRVKITNNENATYTLDGKTLNNASTRRGSTIFYGNTQASDTEGFRAAYWVFDSINDGWAFHKNRLNYSLDKALVNWTDGSEPGSAFYFPTTDQPNARIVIAGIPRTGNTYGAEAFPHTILHEYGHFIMHSVYQSNNSSYPPADCGKRHSVQSPSEPVCAWSEGWANFVAALVSGTPSLRFSTYSNPVNIETRVGFASGTSTEGNVAAALWDIHDSGRELEDNIRGGSSKIWNSFDDPKEDDETHVAKNVLEFRDDWKDNGYESLDSIFRLNTLIPRPVSPPPVPPTPTETTSSFVDQFQGNSDKWIMSGDKDWKIKDPKERIPHDSTPGNESLVSDNCDNQCIATISSSFDTRKPLTITFDRFVDSSVDSGEGLFVQYSTDGTTWTDLASYTHDNRKDTDTWVSESLTLDITADSAQIRFVAKSSRSNEDIEIDNVRILVSDTTAPTISAVSDITVTTSGGRATVTFALPTATDNIDGSVIVRCDHASGSTFNLGTTTVTCSATDRAGNRAAVTFRIIVASSDNDGGGRAADRTPPAITAPADVTVEATGPRTAASLGTATATDAVDSDPTVTNNAPATFPLGTTTVTWTATDDAGNSATDTQTVTVQDTTAPTITAPSDITAEAAGTTTPVRTGAATASDTVDSSVTVTSDAPASFPLGRTTVTWTATDDSGNSATATQTVTVQDTTAPSVTAPADATLEATAPLTPLGAAQYGTATATDAADSSVTVTSDAPASFPLGDTTITWTATDSSGNSATDAQTVTVRDTTAPSVTAPNNVVAEAVGTATPVQTGAASASDAVDSSPTITSDAPATFPLGATTVTWTATDDAGNSGTAAQTVTVRDTTAPSITAPPDVAAEASGAATAVSLGSASSTDSVDGSVTVTNDAPHGFPLGATTVTWTATDDSDNSATDTQVVTVRDTSAPAIAAPSDVIAEAGGRLTTVVLGTATATDSADADVAVTNDAPPGFPLGTTTVTWTATDDAGNSATATQAVTVRDTTAPAITAPGDITAEATGLRTPVVLGTATATDAVDSSVVITSDAPWSWNRPAELPAAGETRGEPAGLGSGTDRRPAPVLPAEADRDAPPAFPLGTTTVTWTATDDSGNSATDTQTVTVRDTTPPAITAPPDITVEATGTLTSVMLGTATATDSIDGAVTVTNDAPSSFPLGDTSVMWTATDSAGNSAAAAQTVTVRDTTAPAITAPGDITAEATGLRTGVVLGTATATDTVDPSVDISNDAPWSWNRPAELPAAGETSGEPAGLAFGTDPRPEPVRPAEADRDAPPAFPLGSTTVTWTATDSSGNSSTDTQTVTIQDTKPPLVSAPFEAVLEATGTLTPFGSGDYGAATVTDNSGQDIAVSSSAPELFPLGLTVIVYSATDSSGNVGIDVQSVWVGDTTPPVIAVPEARTFEATGPLTELGPGDYGTPEITDAFGFSASNDAPSSFPLGTTVITHSATDAYANSATAEQTVVLADTTPPGFAQPETAYAVVSSASDAVEFDTPTAADLVDGAVSVSCDPSPGARLGLGTATVVCTAADGSGNSSAVSFDVEVSLARSGAPPVIVPPPDAVFEATGMLTPLSSVDYGSATATDGAGGAVPVSSDAPASFPLGATVVTYTATSTAGLGTGATQVITVQDTTPPNIKAPSDVEADATGFKTILADIGLASATDAVDAAVEVSSDAPDKFPQGGTTVTWTATDDAGNSATDTQKVTLAGPVETILHEKFDSLDAWTKSMQLHWRSAEPNEAGHPPGHQPPNRVAKASSCATCVIELNERLDLTGYSSASLSIQKYIDPAPNWPAFLYVFVDIEGYTRWNPAGTWLSDSSSQTWTSETIDLSEYLGKSNLKLRLWASGGGTTVDYMIDDLIIRGTPVLSDSPPAVSARDFAVVRGSSATAAVSASDPDGDQIALSISGNPDFVQLLDGGSGPAAVTASPSAHDSGVYQITVTAVANKKTTTAAFSVHVIDEDDSTAPTIEAPADIAVEASSYTSVVSLGSAISSDDSGVPPAVTNDAPDGFPVGITTVTWTATDSFGNASADTQVVTVADTAPPVFAGTDFPPVTYGERFVDDVVAIDAVDGDLTGSITRTGTVDASAVGTYPVTYSVSDSSGNAAQFAGAVRVVDYHPPIITLNGSTNVLVKTGGSFTDPGATAVDQIVNTPLAVSVRGQTVDTGTTGVYHITYHTTDAHGHNSMAQRTVTVNPNPDSPPGTYMVIRNPAVADDGFGTAVSGLGSDMVAVGAPFADNNGLRSGAVYIFDANTGELIRKLQHHDPKGEEWFGESIEAVGDDKMLVSSTRESVHLYDTTNWTRLLDIDDPVKGAYPQAFGQSIAVLDNGNLVVPDHVEWSSTGSRGVVYVFDQQGKQVLKILNPLKTWSYDLGFGHKVIAVENDILVLGERPRSSDLIYRFNGLTGVLLDTKTAPSSNDWRGFGRAMESDPSAGLLVSNPHASRYSGKVYVYGEDETVHEIAPYVSRSFFSLGKGIATTSDNIVLTSDYRYDNGKRYGGLYVYDRDDTSKPFAFIPNPSLRAPDSGLEMQALVGNKIIVDNSKARALGVPMQVGEVFLVDTGSKDPAPAVTPSSDTHVVPSSETRVSVRIPAVQPDAARQYAGAGEIFEAPVPAYASRLPVLLGFDLEDGLPAPRQAAPTTGAPSESGHVLVVLRFDTAVDDILMFPWDFEVWSDGEYVPVADAAPSGNTVILEVDRDSLGGAGGLLPDPGTLDIRVLAPWAAVPTVASEGAAVEITGIDVHDRSIQMSWNMFGDQKQYKAVITPVSDPKSKFADTVQDSVRYRFVNLEPDTEYEIRIGVRGDDSTQTARIVKTLPAGQMEYYSGLGLGVIAVPGNAELSWTDINDTGNGRYRVERSVDGGPFVEIEKQPGASTEATDSVNPEWHGKQITYRVFEWVGKQKLYSDEVSFVPISR